MSAFWLGVRHVEGWLVPKPKVDPILTPDEVAWLKTEMDGIHLEAPKAVCYDREKDPWTKRRAKHFHESCGGRLAKGDVLVTVTVLSTGRKIVGKSTITFTPDKSKTGNRYLKDTQAELYETTSRTVYPLWRNEGNALYYGSNFGPTYGSGHDFYMHGPELEKGQCHTGNAYGWKNMKNYNMCNSTSFGVVAFQAWIVETKGAHVITPQQRSFLQAKVPHADLANATVCYSTADAKRPWPTWHKNGAAPE